MSTAVGTQPAATPTTHLHLRPLLLPRRTPRTHTPAGPGPRPSGSPYCPPCIPITHRSCRQSMPLALSFRPTHAPTSRASCRPTAAHPPASGLPCRLLPPCLGSGPTATTAHTGPGPLPRSCFSLHLLTHAPHTYTPWASERATACFLVVLFVPCLAYIYLSCLDPAGDLCPTFSVPASMFFLPVCHSPRPLPSSC